MTRWILSVKGKHNQQALYSTSWIKGINPLYFKELWLPRPSKKPHLLTSNILGCRSALHLIVHGLLCPHQAFVCEIKAFLIISCPLSYDLIFNFLWFIANMGLIYSGNVEWWLTNCTIKAWVVFKFKGTQSFNPLLVPYDISSQISFPSLLGMFCFPICLGIICGRQNRLDF